MEHIFKSNNISVATVGNQICVIVIQVKLNQKKCNAKESAILPPSVYNDENSQRCRKKFQLPLDVFSTMNSAVKELTEMLKN